MTRKCLKVLPCYGSHPPNQDHDDAGQAFSNKHPGDLDGVLGGDRGLSSVGLLDVDMSTAILVFPGGRVPVSGKQPRQRRRRSRACRYPDASSFPSRYLMNTFPGSKRKEIMPSNPVVPHRIPYDLASISGSCRNQVGFPLAACFKNSGQRVPEWPVIGCAGARGTPRCVTSCIRKQGSKEQVEAPWPPRRAGPPHKAEGHTAVIAELRKAGAGVQDLP